MMVIIVENNKSLLKIYTQELEKIGLNVIPPRSRKEVVRQVKEERPDLVILDTIPEDVDGLQVLDEIKAYDNTIPVILNVFYKKYDMDSRSELADDYIIKTPDLSEFLEKVRRYTDV